MAKDKIKQKLENVYEIIDAYKKNIAFLGYDINETYEIMKNELVLDTTSMFVQNMANFTLDKDLYYIFSKKFQFNNIRNSLSHDASKANSIDMINHAKYFLGFDATVAIMANKENKKYKKNNERIFSNVEIEGEVEFIKTLIKESSKNIYLIASARYNFDKIKQYMKSFNIKNKQDFIKDDLIFKAVCFNLINGIEYIKLASKKAHKDFYKGYEELKEVRDTIAHRINEIDKGNVYDVIKDYKKMLCETYNKNKESIQKEKIPMLSISRN